jgi:hypothetical protein
VCLGIRFECLELRLMCLGSRFGVSRRVGLNCLGEFGYV